MIHIPDSVYPKDEEGNALCPRCRKTLDKCSCPGYEAPKIKAKKFNPVIRLDKSGRKGKVVTMITGLPANEETLKTLSKMLKTKTGSGGTCYIEDASGVIEIQGDHKDAIRKIMEENNP